MLTSIYGYARFRQRASLKWSLKLTEVDQTWLNLSWSGCAQTDMAILKYSTRGPSLFSDRNEKMGFVRARVHLESSNFVSRHIFYARLNGMVYFAVAPSIGVVYFVTEMRKWAQTELGST